MELINNGEIPAFRESSLIDSVVEMGSGVASVLGQPSETGVALLLITGVLASQLVTALANWQARRNEVGDLVESLDRGGAAWRLMERQLLRAGQEVVWLRQQLESRDRQIARLAGALARARAHNDRPTAAANRPPATRVGPRHPQNRGL